MTHLLLQVVFQPQNVMTMARAGQPLSEVASQADVFIRSFGAFNNGEFGIRGERNIPQKFHIDTEKISF